VGKAHIYDENEYRAQRPTPSRIQSSDSAREWRTFMMKMNTAHSVPHRHGSKVTIRCGSEHLAQRSTPSRIQSGNSVKEWRTFMMTPRMHRSTVLLCGGSGHQHLTLSTPPEPRQQKLVWGITMYSHVYMQFINLCNLGAICMFVDGRNYGVLP
jgi:hypothetical protein